MIAALLLLAQFPMNRMWFAVPLIISVSLVYAGTRHEAMRPILRHAVSCAVWMTGFIAAIMLLLWLLGG
ncbi:MAG: hypothetical protein DWQ31_03890 [Planctomycetota bacterium]|mgnify:CR=1 FL=1|nr:MAG: hypothetical protein DWQ31_03890 [Planctomycetota bacterium]REJ94112.1 MAG: hypothetical protein DWQ35_08810 [Planctomycetota bacterium]REK26298.1 MAG: hypothetical protein DWQ42_09400 [Planctomycetota bacterium]REK45849.1 MAG: hypothetical protein DWQ46_08115 [Planctomycetota bacterium]